MRVLDPKMEESSIIRRALGTADDAVHRRRHGLPLFGEEVRRVVASDRGDVARDALEAPAGRRRLFLGLAGAEPVEERGHLACVQWEAVNMLSVWRPLSGSGDGSPMAAAIKPGRDAVDAFLRVPRVAKRGWSSTVNPVVDASVLQAARSARIMFARISLLHN